MSSFLTSRFEASNGSRRRSLRFYGSAAPPLLLASDSVGAGVTHGAASSLSGLPAIGDLTSSPCVSHPVGIAHSLVV